MKKIIEHKFEIGDFVYHRTPESRKGIVVDWFYSECTKTISYKVAWNELDESTCEEIELTDEKVF